MWVTYGPKWVWKRMFISLKLLSASKGGVACVCAHVECVYVCTCFIMRQGGMSGRPTPTAGGAQLCDRHRGGSQPPSSHPPFCNNIVWWTTTSSLITPDQSPSFRAQCVWAYCKCNWRSWKSARITLYSFWATVQVFVFLIWVWFAVGAESDGKYWILPLHLSTSLINPVSPCHSPSLLALPSVTFSLLLCCLLIINVRSSRFFFVSQLLPGSLALPLVASLSSSAPSCLPSLCSVEELLQSFPLLRCRETKQLKCFSEIINALVCSQKQS